VAMKMAVQLWQQRGERRSLFLALDGAYHGDTFGAMAAGGVTIFHGAFGDLLCEVRRLPVPVSGRTLDECVAALESALATDGGRVAAVIVEPIVQGAGGMRIHSPEFLRALRDATARHGVPLVADEVFTGFGRTGRMFACEHAAVAPDLLCLSKGLTGGVLPLGATLVSEAIYDAFLAEDRARTFFHGHSFTANPIACAVARESLALLDETSALERVASLEALFAARLARLRELPPVADVRGIGGLAVVELAAAQEGATGYLDPRGPRLQRALLERGVLLRPLGDVVYFLPPYCVTDAECHLVFDALEEVVAALDSPP